MHSLPFLHIILHHHHHIYTCSFVIQRILAITPFSLVDITFITINLASLFLLLWMLYTTFCFLLKSHIYKTTVMEVYFSNGVDDIISSIRISFSSVSSCSCSDLDLCLHCLVGLVFSFADIMHIPPPSAYLYTSFTCSKK